MDIEIKDLTKSYGELKLFEDFSISFRENKITAIMGPSGCGKTTLLRMIAGLQKPEKGEIAGVSKKLSYIFQDDLLLPWLSVRKNMELVLRSFLSEGEAEKKVSEILELLKLSEFADFLPEQLSGGMRRRVAMGRALVYDGDILLMDEPFKGLDQKLKAELLGAVNSLYEKNPKTVILVTHDREDAELLGDIVYELSGRPVSWKR